MFLKICTTITANLFYSCAREDSSRTFIEAIKSFNLYHQSSVPLNVLEKKVTGVYLGFDPTAGSLHIGHLPSILVLARAANFGIPTYAIIGDSTALIGDPSFTITSRPVLSKSDIIKNSTGITSQLKSIYSKTSKSNAPQLLNNSTWLSQLGLVTFLNDFGRYVKVSELITKDSVSSRLKAKTDGCTFQELTYSLLQAFDFYHLFHNYNINLQIGGSDQWGNMVSGLDFISKIRSFNSPKSEIAYALTLPLITTSKGNKLGKSAGNAIWLSGPNSSAFDIFQFFIKCPDSMVHSWLNYFTLLPFEAIQDILKRHIENPHLYIAQKAISKWVIELLFEDDMYQQALLASAMVFENDTALDFKLLLPTFKKMQKRYFEVSRSEFVRYSDFLDKIIDSNAENIDHIKYVIERNSLTFNRKLITNTENLIDWNNVECSTEQRIVFICIGKSNPYLAMNSLLCSEKEFIVLKDDILKRNANKVALQFPDSLLYLSASFFSFIKMELPTVEFYILADTSYASCCVDEVAAEHVKSDLIIHFGHACMSGTSRLPVLYSFGEINYETKDCITNFSSLVSSDEEKILILSDIQYYHLQELKRLHPKLFFYFGEVDKVFNPRSLLNENNPESVLLSRKIIPWVDLYSEIFPFTKIFFIGLQSSFLTSLIMNIKGKAQIYSFSPLLKYIQEEGFRVNMALSKRYAQIQKSLDASFVGILVGTLGVSKYLSVIDELRSLILRARRRPYIISVGKLNVAKLANFLDIDVFVLVACPETTSLIDGKDFFKPILSPYEYALSVSHLVMENNQTTSIFTTWTSDFKSFLRDQKNTHKFDDISLLSNDGGNNDQKKVDNDYSASNSSNIVRKPNRLKIEYDWDDSLSARRLKDKQFQGLEPLSIEATFNNRKILEGSFGTAAGYQSETS